MRLPSSVWPYVESDDSNKNSIGLLWLLELLLPTLSHFFTSINQTSIGAQKLSGVMVVLVNDTVNIFTQQIIITVMIVINGASEKESSIYTPNDFDSSDLPPSVVMYDKGELCWGIFHWMVGRLIYKGKGGSYSNVPAPRARRARQKQSSQSSQSSSSPSSFVATATVMPVKWVYNQSLSSYSSSLVVGVVVAATAAAAGPSQVTIQSAAKKSHSLSFTCWSIRVTRGGTFAVIF